MPEILLTRPRAASERFAAELPEGWRALIAPLMEIEFRKIAVGAQGAAGVVFSSANGVEAWRRAGGGGVPAFCVGGRTARAAREAGCEVMATGADLAALVPLLPGGRLIHVRGVHTTRPLAELVPGAEVEERIGYAAAARPLTDEAQAALAAGILDAVACFSPRSAALLVAEARAEWRLERTRLVALSGAVAQALSPLGRPVEIAARPDAAALRDVLLHCDDGDL
ncbi:uroporphyrinogen-III synthase [Roseobacter sp. HKCCA0434]|uniref:uroporphyrinogen-III synthase n=1 Tax=Roseobacter sp. HKCCA0434 TaxID=3079297 RepID=UPI0029057DE7|nr:uroporphyrinogen-III synthase [Roseobacter sp. HKCCA0434]